MDAVGVSAYVRPVRSLMSRLLLLLSMLLMPLSMGAPAAAASHHGASASMSMEHCPDSEPQAPEHNGATGRTMPCAAALSAISEPPLLDERVGPAAAKASPLLTLAGVELDIATPPPKRA